MQDTSLNFKKVILYITIIWIVFGTISFFATDNWEDRGTFGDMFGAINVLFSGLAFGAVVYTIHLQRQDINIQREVQKIQLEDLRLQSEAAVSSAEQLASQQRLMNFQICQSTVINFIQLKNRFVNDFKIPDNTDTRAINSYKENNFQLYHLYCITESKDAVAFRQYFRLFFYTLQYIHDSDVDERQKQILADMLNMETTDIEMDAIFIFNSENQHRLLLLQKYGFRDRFFKIER